MSLCHCTNSQDHQRALAANDWYQQCVLMSIQLFTIQQLECNAQGVPRQNFRVEFSTQDDK